MSVRTAGQIVAELDAPPRPPEQPVRVPAELGAAGDPQVMVSRTQLGAVLRSLRPAQVDLQLTPSSSWYALRVQPGDVHVEDESLERVAAAAVHGLRAWAERSANGATGDPAVWLVHASTDDELRAWMGLTTA